jgi:signal transduction histidine kinase
MWATSIGTKTIAMFLVLVIILTGLAVYSMDQGRDYTIEAVGIASVHYASFITSVIERTIYLKYHELYQTSLDVAVQSALVESNAEFAAMEDSGEYLSTIDAEWLSTPPNETTPSMDEILANNISARMRDELVEHYLEEHGVTVYSSVSVVNEYGAVIAMSVRTEGYSYAGHDWWPELMEDGDYFGAIEEDPITNTHGMCVFVRVDDPDGKAIGGMMAFLNIVGVIDESVYLGKAYSSTELKLITTDGRVIYSDGAFRVFDDISGEDYYSAITENEGYFTASEGDREKLFAYASSTGYLRYGGGDWIVVVDHDASEVLQPVEALRMSIVVSSALVIAASLVLFALFGHSISRRIRILATTADSYSRGDLEARIDMKSSDEIGQLAEAFNSMAGELSTLYRGLEDRVRDRTKELEQATAKLRLLGSITRHDALNQVAVIKGWVTIVEDMVDDEEVVSKLGKIAEASTNLERYLEFTGVYERVGVKEPEWIDLETAVTHSLFGLGPQEFELNNALVGVKVFSDPMLPKVFRNLVENSLKHGDGVRRISFSHREDADGLVIVYEDDGVGIPDGMKEKVFERTSKAGRISFGLYLSRTIVSITGMTMVETGVHGNGARFEIHVPTGYYRVEAAPSAEEK